MYKTYPQMCHGGTFSHFLNDSYTCTIDYWYFNISCYSLSGYYTQLFLHIMYFEIIIFFIHRLKKRDILWKHVWGPGGIQTICPLNNFNTFHCIIIKLCEFICWQRISAKFDNHPDPIKHFGVMVLVLAKFAKSNLVHSVTRIFFNGS